MRSIPSFLTLPLTMAAMFFAGTALGAAAPAAGKAAAKDTAVIPAPAAKPVPPVPASPVVFRASGTSSPSGAAETLDTGSVDEAETVLPALPAVPATAAPEAGGAPDSGTGAAQALPTPASKTDTVKKVVEPTYAEAPGLTRLDIGGTFQLKAFFHDFTADADADKSLSFQMRRARMDFQGRYGDHFSFEAQLNVQGDGQALNPEAIYLAWKFNDFIGIRGGKIKRTFSQEALQSSKDLYTIERGLLYQDFLEDTTGYSLYDLGVVFHGGFVDEDVPVTYEAGVFNGKQSNNAAQGYANQQYVGIDPALKAKDFSFRLAVQPFKPLKMEACISTKAAEDTSDPEDFSYSVNTAYEVGMDLLLGRFRFLGEAAWGDNPDGVDAKVISGSSLFFAFYGTGIWREDYSRGRASELLLKLEGLDPDFEPGSGEGATNDGQLRYTVGCNYFFNSKVSVMANYSILQPITGIPGDDELVQDIDALWRMSF